MAESFSKHSKRKQCSHAEKTIPTGFILQKSKLSSSGRGIFAKKLISKGSIFGPYEGQLVKQDQVENADTVLLWKITDCDLLCNYVDGRDETTGNWLGYIAFARSLNKSNLNAFQYELNIFYYATRDIPIGEELLVWHGDENGGALDIVPVEENGKRCGYPCKLCGDVFLTNMLLDAHHQQCKGERQLRNRTVTNKNIIHEPIDISLSTKKTPETGLKKVRGTSLNNNESDASLSSSSADSPSQSDTPVTQPFTCEHCERTFAWLSHLEIHTRIHTGEKPYVCTTCDKSFTRKYQLKLHMRVHTDERPHACKICGKKFKQKAAVGVHELSHIEEKPFPCNGCDKKFATEARLKMHQKVHTGDRPFACAKCPLAFTQKCHLMSHMKIHREVHPHQCNECGRRFSRNTALKQHQFVHASEKPFACEQCPKHYASESGLRDHMRSHTGEKPFECDVCGKKWRTNYKLRQHMETHAGVKSYHCELCTKSFRKKSHLDRHIASHSNERPYSCSECANSFKDQNALKAHMVRHTQEQQPTCDTCHKTFASEQTLRVHKQMHAGETFKCQECSKTFSRKKSLDLHMTIHLGTQPFPCDECDRKFVRKRSLMHHKTSHTKELLVSYNLQEEFVSIRESTFRKGRIEPEYNYRHVEDFLDAQDARRGKRYICGECNGPFSKSKFRMHKIMHKMGFKFAFNHAQKYHNSRRYPYFALDELY